jgi:hypothetical protein
LGGEDGVEGAIDGVGAHDSDEVGGLVFDRKDNGCATDHENENVGSHYLPEGYQVQSCPDYHPENTVGDGPDGPKQGQVVVVVNELVPVLFEVEGHENAKGDAASEEGQ